MARCNDCNKFVSLDSEQEPEINLDVDDEGHVTGSFEISNTCAECGSEVTQATLDVDVDPSQIEDAEGKSIDAFMANLTDAQRKLAAFEVENEEGERESRTEGKGRGTKTFYGATIRFDVKLTIEGEDDNGKEVEKGEHTFSGTFTDEIQASFMDVI